MRIVISLLMVSSYSLYGADSPTLEKALARMDQNSAAFKSMSAKIHRTAHVAVINDDNVDQGALRMRRSKKEAQVLVELTSPDPKTVAVNGPKVELYLPKMQQVEEYDLGKNRVEKYLALGFGASGKDLKADYDIRELGKEQVNGQSTLHLELTPKSKQIAQQFPKIELWIAEATGYPAQQKFHQTGGDYMLAVYSDVAINPSLPDSAFRLNLPKGVKRVFPGK